MKMYPEALCLDSICEILKGGSELTAEERLRLIQEAIDKSQQELHPEVQYLNLIRDILENGKERTDRTGVGTIGVFKRDLRIDLSKGFPLLGTKRVPFRLIATELIWFLSGDTNIRYLLQNKNYIWNEWPFRRFIESEDYQGEDLTDFWIRAEHDPEFKERLKGIMDDFVNRILEDDEFAEKWGGIGNGYGRQWRHWVNCRGEIYDQISQLIALIQKDPTSRRLLVSAWNAGEVHTAALPPCHDRFQFYVSDNKLSCWFSMRSTDVFLGLPFNIASYALLTYMIAYICGLEVGELCYSGGDVHIYKNHIEQVKLQISREPRPFPTLTFAIPEGEEIKTVFDFKPEHFVINNYNPHPAIKGEVAV